VSTLIVSQYLGRGNSEILVSSRHSKATAEQNIRVAAIRLGLGLHGDIRPSFAAQSNEPRKVIDNFCAGASPGQIAADEHKNERMVSAKFWILMWYVAAVVSDHSD
jgi:hypothetical protein